LRLNRPDKLNAVNAELRQAVLHHLDRIEDDPEIRAVLLIGAGRAFCSGNDRTQPQGPRTPAASHRRMTDHHRVVKRLWNFPKPIVGAARGPVVGMGWSYALCCDILYASETAQFWQPLVGRGGVPDGGHIWLITRQIGALKAQDIVYANRKLSAREAFELGLVTQLVEDTQLDDVAMARARELAAMPTFAFGLTKSLFRQNSGTLEEFLLIEHGDVPLAGLARTD